MTLEADIAPGPAMDAPRTMTRAGLRFLEALAHQRCSGVFLEIGPLFGSSTRAIDRGRTDASVAIHTIDTFEPAPWVRKRLGIDLSRAAFDRYTHAIENLHVHQGFAPGVVRDTWSAPIGFYFDDATHGDPGWTDNFEFFRPYFADDAIICGDDFASGWPDIVRNVARFSEENALSLFVIGRVWALALKDEDRISAAVHYAFPALKSYEWEVSRAGRSHRSLAASWSVGLHRAEPLSHARLLSHDDNDTKFSAAADYQDGRSEIIDLCDTGLDFGGLVSLRVFLPRKLGLQVCIGTRVGKTRNSKSLLNGAILRLGEGEFVSSIRLSDH